MKIFGCLFVSLFILNVYSQSEESPTFKNQLGINWVYLGSQVNHGLEIEYRRNFKILSFRGAIGYRGINPYS